MSKMNHINVIEKYDEHHRAIHQLLLSILSCFVNEEIFTHSQKELTKQLDDLCKHYPFISLLYILDANGKQISLNIWENTLSIYQKQDKELIEIIDLII